MPYFLLPRLPPSLYTYIHLQDASDVPQPVINESLSYYLNDIKHQINLYEHQWETFKRYTNTYEYIHTTIPYKKYCVSRYKPLSRSFFKMIELLHSFELGAETPEPFHSFHLAEGPGGFIEALATFRNRADDTYVGMTLQDHSSSDYNIPAWKKSQQFLQEYSRVVKLENGCDHTGNILSLDNFVYIHEMYGGKMDLVTADGGFDFSTDFDHQEVNVTSLIYGQIVYALCLQKPGGCFVLKVFDMFMQHTVDMVALLSSLYEKVYVTKPNTSRMANSEKYLVCKGFLPTSSYKLYPYLYESFKQMLAPKKVQAQAQDHPRYVGRILSPNAPVNHYFVNRLEEANVVLGQSQIENIYVTLSFMVGECIPNGNGNAHKGNERTARMARMHQEASASIADGETSELDTSRSFHRNKIQHLIKSNIQKCIQWCIQYNLMYNF